VKQFVLYAGVNRIRTFLYYLLCDLVSWTAHCLLGPIRREGAEIVAKQIMAQPPFRSNLAKPHITLSD
jgi:hypothetical protein